MKYFLLFLLIIGFADAAPKKIRVFVALCDNKSQGIVKVGEKIGDGDDPEGNLYWGCDDGMARYFKKTGDWKLEKSEKNISKAILRRLTFKHATADIELIADAYRGWEMRQCVIDFEKAAASGEYDLVAYIGHDALMDFQLPPPAKVAGNHTDVIVLCCLSEKYFGDRLSVLGCKPVLMAQQFMYPGSFILASAIESWRRGGGVTALRAAAGKAYAKNQKISVKSATGVFADLEKK